MFVLRFFLILSLLIFSFPANAYQIYTVKKGDTLIKIAHKFGINPKSIKEINPNIDWLKIKPKDKIKIPDIKTKTAQRKQEDKIENKNIYIIKKGDTLIKIAKRLNYTYEQLKKANPNVDWLKIRPGQKIILPKEHAKKENRPKPGDIGDGYYIVAKGDTLRTIAKRFGLTLQKLRELNPNLKEIIHPGDLIVLPKDLTEKIKISREENLFIPPKYLLYSTIYKVKKGDSLWKIAKKFKTDVGVLRTLNDITGNNIRVGQVIFVPNLGLKESERLKLRYSILNEERHALIKYAERFVGAPYKFGGESLRHGIDCSAFVQKIYRKFHINLPRTAEEQYLAAGVPVSVKHLQPGDLLFFHTMNYAKVTHVAIYIGNGKFIHAAGRKSGVKISRFTRYYWKRFVGAKRVLGVNNQYAYIRDRSG